MDSTTLFGNLFGRDYARRGDLYYRRGSLDKAAEMYRKAGRPVQAAEIYVELGDVDRAVESYREGKRLREAADLLAAQGRHRDASTVYEEAGFHERAAEAALRSGQAPRAARLFQNARMFLRAAEAFQRASDPASAAEALGHEADDLRRRLGPSPEPGSEQRLRQLDRRRAELLGAVGRHGEAARLLAGLGLHAEAAALFARAGASADAARSYLAAGLVQPALAAVDAGADVGDEMRADLYLRAGRHREAGEALERLGRFGDAAEAFGEASEWGRGAAAYEQAGEDERAAELYLRVGRHQEAGRAWSRSGRHREAADAYVKAGNPRAAAAAFEEAGLPYRAAEQYRAAGETTAARDALQRVGPEDADYGRASLLLVPMLLDEGLVEGAVERLSRLERTPRALRDVERLYLEARIAEARGRVVQAEGLFQRVLGLDHGFADADARLAAVRVRVEPLRDSTTTHAPVVEPTDTISFPAVDGAEDADADAAATADGEEPAGPLPFESVEELEPWWEGTTLARGVDARDRRPVVLVGVDGLDAAAGQELRARLREVTALRHPGVLRLREIATTGTRTLLVYEGPAARPLGDAMTRRRLGPLAALNVVGQVAAAVASAHKLALRHQWLSPHTVLVDDEDRVHVAGFGLRETLATDTTSLAYQAPEVRAGGSAALTSDSFSLGLLAVELLQAHLPVDWAARETVEPRRVRWPPEAEAAVPQAVRDLVVACLARDPLARPSLEQLEQAVTSVGLLQGQILAERYEILGELGRGGMSRVYRARDRDLGEEVAIKTVLTPHAGPSEDAERLLQEVRICRRITHPNVVRVHDFGRFPGGIFVIMELLRGPGLDRVIREEAPLGFGRIRDLLGEIAAALGEAHRLDIVHRDLKPANVLLDGGRVKVMDFGIARMGSSSAGLTQTGQVVGSPKYMAPEQIQGLPLTGTCDLYALGVIAYTLVAGHEPFTGETATSIVLKHLHETPTDLREARPGTPEAWVELVGRLLAKRPEDRPQTAEEVRAAIARLPVEDAP